MNLVVFSGFIGSGKTSILLSLARHLTQGASGDGVELVILENELGEVGIDDKIIRAGGFTVKELFAGCICCTLTADLVTTLRDLHEQVQPRWVIFEPTGMAYPDRILETVRQYGKGIDRILVIAVVDAERWEELTEVTPSLIQAQVSAGDLVLINKCDLVNGDQRAAIREQVRAMNATGTVVEVCAVQGIDEGLWSVLDEIPAS